MDERRQRTTCSGGLGTSSDGDVLIDPTADARRNFITGLGEGLGSRSSLASSLCGSVTRMTLETMRRSTSLCSISDAIDSRYVMLRVGSSAGRPAEGDGIVTRRIGGKPKKSQGAGICDRSAIISDVSSCLDACN